MALVWAFEDEVLVTLEECLKFVFREVQQYGFAVLRRLLSCLEHQVAVLFPHCFKGEGGSGSTKGVDDFVELGDNLVVHRLCGNLHDDLVSKKVTHFIELTLNILWEGSQAAGGLQGYFVILEHVEELGDELGYLVPIEDCGTLDVHLLGDLVHYVGLSTAFQHLYLVVDAESTVTGRQVGPLDIVGVGYDFAGLIIGKLTIPVYLCIYGKVLFIVGNFLEHTVEGVACIACENLELAVVLIDGTYNDRLQKPVVVDALCHQYFFVFRDFGELVPIRRGGNQLVTLDFSIGSRGTSYPFQGVGNIYACFFSGFRELLFWSFVIDKLLKFGLQFSILELFADANLLFDVLRSGIRGMEINFPQDVSPPHQ